MAERMIPGGGRGRDGESRATGRVPGPAVAALIRRQQRTGLVVVDADDADRPAPGPHRKEQPLGAGQRIRALTALKTIESVINEVQMIANQVRQIETMVQNTQGFSRGLWDTDAQPRLLRLGEVIDQEQAIAYTMANVDGLFRQRYPGYRPVTDWSSEYELWTRTTLDTLRGTLNSVRLHGEDFATAQGRIQALQALSESAAGRMQALQVGNMMAAEQLQQLVQLRQLVMAQINAQNVYMAAQTNREAQRAATQSEWIRNGNIDAPPLEGAAPGVRRGVGPGR